MNKRTNITIPSLLFIGLLSSCELVINVDLPPQKQKLVVNSVFNTDSLLIVSVTQSRHILDDQNFFSPVDNATLSVTDETGTVFGFAGLSQGLYKSTFSPAPGKIYFLRVEAGGFDPVTAVTRAPDLVPIVDAEIDYSEVQNGTVNPRIPVKIAFRDPGDQKNYYEAKVFRRLAVQYTDSSQEIIYDTLNFMMPVLYQDSNQEERTSVFVDTFFNGEEYTLESNLPNSGSYGWGGTVVEDKIVLINISPEYYDYLTTRNLQQNTDGDPFAQPVLVFSNIENGFGIFAGYCQSVWEF
jgi:Domain of unknown function (DUF4249)